jgi:hypothetical protein
MNRDGERQDFSLRENCSGKIAAAYVVTAAIKQAL